MIRQVDVASRRYTIAPDDPMPIGRRCWGVVSALLVDEITERPPLGPVFIAAPVPSLRPRVAATGGLVGLVGIPSQVFPDLMNRDYAFDLTVGGAGYLPRRIPATVGQQAGFPDEFAPVALPDLPLHRPPVVIRGRATRLTQGRIEGRDGADIRITGVWPTLAALPNNAEPPDLLALQPPLYLARSVAAGRLRRHEIVAAPGPAKRLLADVSSGGDSLRLSDRVGLAAGAVLWLAPDDPERMEYLPLTAVAGATTPNQPATATLAYPLAYAHRAGTPVRLGLLQPLPPAGQGFTKQLTRPALPGDGVVFLTNLNRVDLATVVEVRGGGPPEYHRFRRYAAVSDGQGYFRLPPISRLAQVELTANHAQHPNSPPPRLLTLRYDGDDNRLDFRFR